MERALRERGEGADRLDLVAEELNPERLPARRGKDVDEAAANRDVPALVRPLNALVARERELLDQAVDAALVSGNDLEGLRPRSPGRHSLAHRGAGGPPEAP